MQIQDVINRGKNLLAISYVAVAGIAFLPEVFFEKDTEDKVDDALMVILAIIAVLWYRKGNNKFKRTWVPVVFLGLSFCTKILAIVIEHADQEAVGDDIGGLTFLLAALIFIAWQFWKKDEVII